MSKANQLSATLAADYNSQLVWLANGWYNVSNFKLLAPKTYSLSKTKVWDTTNDLSKLPNWTIVEQNGIEYVIQWGKPVKKQTSTANNQFINSGSNPYLNMSPFNR
jgi:hypothetical protein